MPRRTTPQDAGRAAAGATSTVDHSLLVDALHRREDELVVAATARVLGGADDEDRPASGPSDEELGREQQRFHLQHLAAALAADRPALFHEYVRWAGSALQARGLTPSGLEHHLRTLAAVIADHLGPRAGETTRHVIDDALRAHATGPAAAASELDPVNASAPLAGRFLDTALGGDRRGAVGLAVDAADDGTPLEALYLDVFAPCLREVGRRWEVGAVTVAQEHLVTATTQLAMAQLYPRLFATQRTGRTVVVASVGGELHEVGARMVADLFELRGWDSSFVGASTPIADLVAHVTATAPDVLAISATLPTHVEQVRSAIAAVRAEADPIILVGGRPFALVPDLWQQVGADGTAPDAATAVEIAAGLVRTAWAHRTEAASDRATTPCPRL